jgi:sugar transferase (PEP-CTERM/EpsH1 system associated)
LKILLLAHRIPFPPNKGEKIRTYHQLKFLHEQGHQIYVICPFEDEEELQHFQELNNRHCEQVVGQELAHKGVRFARGLLTGKALSVSNFYHDGMQQQVDNLLKAHQFDALLCTASSMAEYVFKADNQPALPPLFMDFMDLDSDKWRQYADQASIPMKWIYQRESKLVATFERKVAQRFNACFFITETECAMFQKDNPECNNIFAIENGLDTSAFHPALHPPQVEHPVLIFTGVMDYEPNVDAVLWFVQHVWPLVIAKWPKAEFYVAGMNPNSKIQALEKMNGITVTGFVDDILPYFHRANMFVAPFRIARGVQNKVLQAFACGLPVITTPMGAEGIHCEDGVDIMLANEPKQFFNCIEQLMCSKELATSISTHAVDTIKHRYEWDALLHPMLDIMLKNEPSNE